MSKTILSLAVGSLLLALGLCAEAQQAKKVPLIGFIDSGTPSSSSGRIEAFRQGLRDLNYIEGKNILVEYRYAEGKNERFPSIVAELVQLKVDVLVAHS